MKRSVLFAGILALTILSISIVAAQALPAPPIATSDIITFFTNLLTGTAPGTADVFAKFLLLILLITVLSKPAEMITKTRTPAIIVATVISILGLRFLSAEMISGILLPYGTVAIVVSTFVPFLLLAYFLNDIPFTALRKVGWLMTAVVFIGLWWFRFKDIGGMAYVYAITAALSIILFLFDRTIQNWKIKLDVNNETDARNYIQITKMQQDIADYTQLLPSAGVNTPQERALLRQIKERQAKINTLLKQLSK
jgi:hypothetical protein